MRKIKIIFCISFLIVSILSGCGKQEPNIDLSNIDISNIDKILTYPILIKLNIQELQVDRMANIHVLFQKAKVTDLLSY